MKVQNHITGTLESYKCFRFIHMQAYIIMKWNGLSPSTWLVRRAHSSIPRERGMALNRHSYLSYLASLIIDIDCPSNLVLTIFNFIFDINFN